MEIYRYQVDRGIERISKPPYCIFRVNGGANWRKILFYSPHVSNAVLGANKLKYLAFQQRV